MADFKLLKEMQQAMQPKKTTEPYDTTAEVRRIEGKTAWVHIPGGVDETPVELTINAKEGDAVRVRVSGGQAWLVGNNTAPPTDDAEAKRAKATAGEAFQKANTAEENAEQAAKAAESAQASAENASEYASRALVNLSTVQSVVETLAWITEHGTMTQTTDTEIDQTHVYFVVDAEGDYVVGSTHYSVVTEPRVEDIATYYELSIDESLNNYVATHLAVTNEGLWILPATTGYKILIATGNGTTYTAAGTYIIDASGATVARFGSNVILGESSRGHATISRTKFTLYGSNGSTVVAEFGVNNDGSTGVATVTEKGKTSTNSRIDGVLYYGFSASYIPTSITSCMMGETDVTSSTRTDGRFVYNSLFTSSTEITLVYTTNEPVSFANFNGATATGARAFANGKNSTASGNDSASFGNSADATGVGSFAEGGNTTASGRYAHAEGLNTTASGYDAHAEGSGTVASGDDSHAEGRNCVAAQSGSHASGEGTITTEWNQTVVGQYNRNDTTGDLFVVGNGEDDNNRSDAFSVDIEGNARALAMMIAQGGMAMGAGTSETDPNWYLCLSSSFAQGGVFGYITKANMKKAMLADDSDWQSVTFTSDFANYSTATPPANPLQYRRVGKIVELTGAAKPTRVITGSADTVTICTLPSGYRPAQTVYEICHGSGTDTWLLTISAAGNVMFSRYERDKSYYDTTANTWLPIHAVFFTD